jgi:hypothetical protein
MTKELTANCFYRNKVFLTSLGIPFKKFHSFLKNFITAVMKSPATKNNCKNFLTSKLVVKMETAKIPIKRIIIRINLKVLMIITYLKEIP